MDQEQVVSPDETQEDDATLEEAQETPDDDGQQTDDVEAMKRALKKANAEAKKSRLRLRELEEAEEARAAAEMSELERAQKAAEKARAERDTAQQQLREWRVRHAVEMAARDANFHDPADALALADLSEIEVDGEGNVDVSGVAAAVARLAKSKPHLTKQAAGSGGRVPSTPPASNGATVTSEELKERRRAFERNVRSW